MTTKERQYVEASVQTFPSLLAVAATDEVVIACGAAVLDLLDLPVVPGNAWDSICLDPLPAETSQPIALRFGQPNRSVLVGALVSRGENQLGDVVLLQLQATTRRDGCVLSADFRLDAQHRVSGEFAGLAAIFGAHDDTSDFSSLTTSIYTPDILPVIDQLTPALSDEYRADIRSFPPNVSSRTLSLRLWPDDDGVRGTVSDITPLDYPALGGDAETELYRTLDSHSEPWVLYEVSSGMVLFVNQLAEKLIGYGCVELRVATDLVLWHDPSQREEWVDLLTQLRRADGFAADWIGSNGNLLELVCSARILDLQGVQAVMMHLGLRSEPVEGPLADPRIARFVDRLCPYGEFRWQVAEQVIQGSPRFYACLGITEGERSDAKVLSCLDTTPLQLATNWAAKASASVRFLDSQTVRANGATLIIRTERLDAPGPLYAGTVEETRLQISAEDHAAELEPRLAAIFNASPTPVIVTGSDNEHSDNVILAANPAACALFDCSQDGLVGEPPRVIFGSNAAEFVRVRAELTRGGGSLNDTEAEIRTRTDEPVPVLLNNRIFSVQGKVHGLWQITDLRERKTSQKDLLLALQRLEQAQSIGKIGDFRWNPGTKELIGSVECLRILGLSPDHGDAPLIFDFPEVLSLSRAAVEGVLQRLAEEDGEIEQSFSLEIEGQSRRVNSRGLVEHSSDGSRWLVGTVQDVTERYAVEQQRREIESKFQETQRLESLGMLAGGVAHDFNNLLVGITGNADLALLEENMSLEARSRIEDVLRASRRAADLTRQLLAYSGKGRFVVEALDLNRLVREISQLLEVTTAKNSVLRYQLGENLPAVECDATQIRQVIMNLIVNASESIVDRQGVVTISTGVQNCTVEYLRSTHIDQEIPAGRYVYFEVTDTGQGMGSETIERIFEPFFSTKFSGRGLGLSAVLGIIKGHRGTLKIYSEIGRGTNMKVLLPAVDTIPASHVEDKVDLAWVGDGAILVIDDESTVRELAKRILQPKGFAVLTAKDGNEGIALFRAMQNDIRLVILDLTMPRMNGEECFWELRQIRPDVKVILISGYNEQEATSSFVGRGLSDFVPKPFVAADLLAAVRKALVIA